MQYLAYIKDDNATLIGSGIHEGSLVHVIGDTANREEINQTASKNPEEVGYLNRVSKAMEILDNAKLKIKEFEDAISELKSMPPQQREKQNKTQELGIYLTEILMQALISLDAVDCPPEFQTARSSRKEAVKKCQLLMDHVDSLRSELKQYVSLEDQQQRL
ncbi:hypothetical protein BDF20DRAFT_817507 [Mycotypha africana]|uniref:uncharacterized protein n=1 Tax=Mycotypha africana TaxID=64632 RepID=UPI0022FFE748|nr:uncharacterized protein BDF20DRAFT_817507 [Mycotypha africana]KAI8981910.1 hypothetical protein BDF20DRAFT_817507 [Mycotypha africana]